jgi:hypothetical protein
MVVPVLIRSWIVSVKPKMNPATAQIMIISRAVKKAHGLPDARETARAAREKRSLRECIPHDTQYDYSE